MPIQSFKQTPRRTVIRSVGGYLPESILTNRDLEAMVETSHEWIVQRTGIESRHIVAEDEGTLDMAYKAALDALKSADINGSDLDAIIVATTTPDQIFPSTAAYLQERLGMTEKGFAFDLQAVCSGFLYGLSVADNFIRSGQCQRVLLIGAEAMSRIVDWSDRTTCILFGDGAGAVVLEAETEGEAGILSTHLHSDGARADILHVPAGIGRPEKFGYIEMAGRDVFRHAVNRLAEVVDEALTQNYLTRDDIDWLIPHQANLRIIEATAKKLQLPLERVITTVQNHGNTSAASVPLALYEGYKNNKFQSGDLLLLEAMGAGLTWGSALVRWA